MKLTLYKIILNNIKLLNTNYKPIPPLLLYDFI